MEELERGERENLLRIIEALTGRRLGEIRSYTQYLDNYSLVGLCIGQARVLKAELENLKIRSSELREQNERLRQQEMFLGESSLGKVARIWMEKI